MTARKKIDFGTGLPGVGEPSAANGRPARHGSSLPRRPANTASEQEPRADFVAARDLLDSADLQCLHQF